MNAPLIPRDIERRLLNDWQAGFPLTPAPFAEIGKAVGLGEGPTILAFARLMTLGTISRIGAVFPPGTIGVSTLAAMQVPAHDLERVAEVVSARPEVNHNYEREHGFNVWFVATAADPARLASTLDDIAGESGYEVVPLPLVEPYRIDLGFDLEGAGHGAGPDSAARHVTRLGSPAQWTCAERLLADALAQGLSVTSRPYARLAALTRLDETVLLARIASWVEDGTIKRFGVVVRHRALGWRANAMCVWDVPADVVDTIGAAVAAEPAVTLCYRRARAAQWPYNLYCMIHGRVRADVEREIAALSARHGLATYPSAVLFSRRAFKQRGARYELSAETAAA